MKSRFAVGKIKRDRVILAAIRTPGISEEAMFESLDELKALCRSAGGEVTGVVWQNRVKLDPGSLFGKGKLQEIKNLAAQTDSQLLIYDGELSASQQEKIEQYLDLAVIDRPALILDIFARHARTREAIAQVNLAQLQYLLPRLAGHWTHLERQEAAIGTRGPGETQLETDRRIVRKKIIELKRTLKKIDDEREVQRRRRSNKINYCLVGYTNAGKSSLFNRLCGDSTYVADRLFATLDSTTRRLPIGGKAEILLTDTVGFIRKLPVNLVASFRSTLKEVNSADMLIHVADASSGDVEAKIASVNQVLSDIGAGEIPVLLLFNKIDLVKDKGLLQNLAAAYPGSFQISVKTDQGIDLLIDRLQHLAMSLYVNIKVKVPQAEAKAIGLVSKLMQLSSGRMDNGYLVFQGRILKYELPILQNAGIDIDEWSQEF